MKTPLVFTISRVLASFLFADKRPNILFAFAGDWGRYASAYEVLDKQPSPNSVVKTRNFDRIAEEGVFFTNAFVNSPSCTPCIAFRLVLLSNGFGSDLARSGLGRFDSVVPIDAAGCGLSYWPNLQSVVAWVG